jgi:hypothetical protein
MMDDEDLENEWSALKDSLDALRAMEQEAWADVIRDEWDQNSDLTL